MDRAEYLQELHDHRKIWETKPVLREVYREMFSRIRAELVEGTILEIGSGVGSSKELLPGAWSGDVYPTPWTHVVLDAHELPIADGAVSNLVLVDTLHHLHKPLTFLAEARRVLRPGGRLVFCEPYLSAVSYVFYRWVHREGADPGWDLHSDAVPGTFANQAAESILFAKRRAPLPDGLRLVRRVPFTPASYVLSGGFQRWSLLPRSVLPLLLEVEKHTPAWIQRATGWRVVTTLERI